MVWVAYDTFDGEALDTTKWSKKEYHRDIHVYLRNGRLECVWTGGADGSEATVTSTKRFEIGKDATKFKVRVDVVGDYTCFVLVVGPGNVYGMRYEHDGKLNVGRMVNGVATTLREDYVGSPPGWLMMVVENDNIEFWFNDVKFSGEKWQLPSKIVEISLVFIATEQYRLCAVDDVYYYQPEAITQLMYQMINLMMTIMPLFLIITLLTSVIRTFRRE